MGEQVKLKTVLNNILKSQFKLSDEYRNAVIKNVKDEVSITNNITTNTHIYISWLESALQHWQREDPLKQALIFFIDISIELSKNEIVFVLLHENNIFKRIIHVINTKDFTQDCDTFRSYIKFLDSFTHTTFGRNFLCGSFDCWKTVFKVIPSRKYTEDLSIFLKDLFLKVVNYSKLFSLDLSEFTLTPLMSICSRILQSNLHGIVEEDFNIELLPTMDLVSSTIMCISESVTLDNEWLNHCSNLLTLKKPLMILLKIIEGEELTFELSKLLISFNFLELKQYSRKPREFINLFLDNSVKILDVNITRKFINNLTKLSYHLQRFCLHFSRLVNVENLNLSFGINLSIFLFQTIPILGTCLKIQGQRRVLFIENDEIREQIMWNIMKKMKTSLGESMGELIKTIIKMEDIIPEAHLTLDYLEKSIDILDQECKILSYNSYLYFLGDIVGDVKKNNSITSRLYDSSLVTHIINSFLFCTSKCEVTWKEDKTIIMALDIVTDLLQIPDLPNELIVAALKMLDLAIDKHMAPNLILLVESNSMVSIGDILKTNLNSESEEVRCAASKVLVTISESAKTKYPFFQKLILELKVCQFQVENVFGDEVVEIRVNALKCLQHLVKIDEIWDVFCDIPDVLTNLINLLKIEAANLSRAELVNLVTVIYEQDYFTNLQVKDLYEILTRLGIYDFDVAVRMNTLKFWDVVIKKLLIEEGMIDNKFPEVTFNNKKIVILDENEIQQRLRRFMGKLSEIGCLTVLNACFTSNEKEERQYVDEIVTNLITLLEEYNIEEDNVDLSAKKNYGRDKDLELTILSPRDFLENIAQVRINNIYEDSLKHFIFILDDILRHNNCSVLDYTNKF